MVFPEGEIQDVTVRFMTSITGAHLNMMELCSSGLTYVGENFPCLDKKTVNPVYSKRYFPFRRYALVILKSLRFYMIFVYL